MLHLLVKTARFATSQSVPFANISRPKLKSKTKVKKVRITKNTFKIKRS